MTPEFGPAASTAADRAPMPESAWVYLLRCPDGSLYCGWTNDLARRLKAHQTGKGGARYTKSHGSAAVRLAYAERCADKSAALKREAAVKKLPKAEKEALAARWAADNALTLRMATPDDAAAVADLYNWYVTHGLKTFQYAPPAGLCLRPPLAQPHGLRLGRGDYGLLRAGRRGAGGRKTTVHRAFGAADTAGLPQCLRTGDGRQQGQRRAA